MAVPWIIWDTENLAKTHSQQHPVGHVCVSSQPACRQQPGALTRAAPCTTSCHCLPGWKPGPGPSCEAVLVDVGAVGPKTYTIIKSGPVFFFSDVWVVFFLGVQTGDHEMGPIFFGGGHQTSCRCCWSFWEISTNSSAGRLGCWWHCTRNKWQQVR